MQTVETTEKAIQIEQLLSDSWRAFDSWVQRASAFQTLNIPDEVASVFIPRRVLELAIDPTNVHVLVTTREPGPSGQEALGVLIYERLEEPISDEKMLKAIIGENLTGNRKFNPSSQEGVPQEVDYKHLAFAGLIADGRLSLNDKVLFDHFAEVPRGFPEVVIGKIYRDRKEMRGLGIGTSFYDRRDLVFERLGFRYSVGDVVSSNKDFFERRGKDYHHLSYDIRKALPPEIAEWSNPVVMTLR